MGVPFITLLGDRHAGRVGASILTQLGLTEFIALSLADYVSKARRLALDEDLRADLRTTLRERLRRCGLTDGAHFTRGLEQACAEMLSERMAAVGRLP